MPVRALRLVVVNYRCAGLTDCGGMKNARQGIETMLIVFLMIAADDSGGTKNARQGIETRARRSAPRNTATTCGGTKNARQGIETCPWSVQRRCAESCRWRNEECPSGH